MDDRELVQAFESCTLWPDNFHHAQHVRLAFLYLREAPLLPSLARFVENLKRYAASLGKSGLYHETITWAFFFIIHERMQRGTFPTFEDFAAANADLLTWQPSVLERYYRPETLHSELARRIFVMCDGVR